MNYKILISSVFLSILLVFGPTNAVKAGEGDTIVVQAFTWNSVRDSVIYFPPASVNISKIIMQQTLKCNPAQSPACGEWDTDTRMFTYDHTGVYDSNLMFQANYVVNGSSPDSVSYHTTPSWDYFARWEYFTNRTATISLDSGIVGSGSIANTWPKASLPSEHSQYLWKASELLAAGLPAGDISGMRFNVGGLLGEMRNFTIRFKTTTLSSLDLDSLELDGFSTVYQRNTTFASAGWNTISFTDNFTWDGVSNIMVDFCFDNKVAGTDNTVMGDTVSGFYSRLVATDNYVLEFDGADYIEVPAAAVNSLDKLVTISFWQYGDPLIQPQSDYLFEALDSAGKRVINVHLPWGNSDVYWDAGNDGGSYDRINAGASAPDFEGKWNHWAFTKDAIAGTMTIYLNGNFWLSGNGKNRDMTDIATFKIGSNGNGASFYDGMIDEFRVWDVVVDKTIIKEYMHKEVTPTHPNYANLLLYYQFKEGTGTTTADSGPGGRVHATGPRRV